MIHLPTLRSVRTIVTHAGCPDGIASAMILHNAIPDARIVFLRHGSPEMNGLTAEPGMLFCDICPPAARVAEFVAEGAIVLDHHGTARDVVAAFEDRGVFGDEKTEPGVCGAWLAYREVWAPLDEGLVDSPATVERFATLAGIRDTWRRDDLRWDEACAQAAALRFYPVEDLLDLSPEGWEDAMAIGPTLMRNGALAVAAHIRDAMRLDVHGQRVAIIPTVETSDVMDALAEEVDIVAGFALRCDNGQARMVVSLRGRGVDVSAIAKRYGGGGHTAAAGFTCDLTATTPHPWICVPNLLRVALVG